MQVDTAGTLDRLDLGFLEDVEKLISMTPSVQTSEFAPAPAGPPPDAPSHGGAPPSTVDTPTTIYNPYAPPTSQGSAGHI